MPFLQSFRISTQPADVAAWVTFLADAISLLGEFFYLVGTMIMKKTSRRRFLQNIALTGCAASAVTTLGGAFPAIAAIVDSNTAHSTPGQIKVGCTSWAFHSFNGGQSPQESIDNLGQMGFDGVELIINATEDLTELWTDSQIAKTRKQLDSYGMEVSQMAIFQPVVQDLSSLDDDKRNIALDKFEAGTKIAKKLGALIVNIVAPWPRELNRPGGGYLPRYYELASANKGDKFELVLDDDFDWQAIWSRYVETTKACVERVKQHDMRFSIEHHTHCLVSDANSFLLLWNDIRDDALGYNLDVGWTMSQREYPPVAIHKVGKHLFNLHMRDIDGLMRNFVHIGDGVMDFPGIIKALKKTGFSGYVSLEQDKFPGDMKKTCQYYLDYMRELIND